MQVKSGVLAGRSRELLQSFFRERREKGTAGDEEVLADD
jgi:hypothetical protein